MEKLVIRTAKDIENFVDAHPSGKRTLLLTFVALGGIFVDAYDFASLGVGIVQLRQAFHLSPAQVGLITAIMALGACLGGVIGGRYIDRLGRFKILIINVALLVISAIGAALSVNFEMLLIFRLLMGIGVGLDFPVALSYVAEIVNKRSENASVGGWQVMWYVAASCSGLAILPLDSGIFGEHLWRFAIGFGAIPAFIILLLRYFYADESPRWAANNLPLSKAAQIVAKTYNIEVEVIPGHEQVKAKSSGKLAILFSPRYRLRTLLISAICITQAIEYFSVGFNLPSISQSIFGNTMDNAILGAIFFNLFGIAGASLGAWLSGKFGVRRMAIFGYAIVILSLLLFSMSHTPLLMAVLLALMIFGHSIGPGQGMTLATLSYPTELRGLGSGWGQGMARGGSIVGFFLFPLLVATSGMASTLMWVAVVPLVGIVIALFIRWDPDRLPQEDLRGAKTSVS
ncbi:MFS transporter [Izhakiella australiensis]|uniref:MFS transporter n=1 Tax=Izhakiella australiensis TaxID=1926881 RepID=A0A1S8YTB3_9GAMM|nr:MFS transporter [Izhakiella australiensis]OON42076.1 MFS transporter [Izhakiella australiensis]